MLHGQFMAMVLKEYRKFLIDKPLHIFLKMLWKTMILNEVTQISLEFHTHIHSNGGVKGFHTIKHPQHF